MFPSILGSNRPTTKYASKRPKLPLKRRLKSLQIRPQNYTYLFLYFQYTFFFTHILQVNTMNLFHIQIHLAWVGIVQIILGNQERNKTFERRQTKYWAPDWRFLGFKPLPERTNAKQSINLFWIILIFYLNNNGSQLKRKCKISIFLKI